ncbi:MAG: glutamate racemase [bacterium]
MKTISSESSVGIFDSGIGGLTVFKQLRHLMPSENLLYLGDTARVPYGSKSVETIKKYSQNNVDFLLKKNVKVIVVACNTASASALDYLKKKFEDIIIIGVVHPAVEYVLTMEKVERVGVIGTDTTISTESYKKELEKIMKVEVYSRACGLFVPFVEEGLMEKAITMQIIEYYLEDLKKKNIDTLILGCTHYPMLKKPLGYYFGDKVRIVDSAYHAAVRTKQILAEKGLLNKSNKNPRELIYVTDNSPKFRDVAQRFLGRDIHNIKHI